MICPIYFVFLFFENIKKAAPRIIKYTAYWDTFNPTNTDVITVPMLAPIIIPIDCSRVIKPERIKPIANAVVPELDWIKQVTNAPITIPLNGLEVYLSMISFILSPEYPFKPSPMYSIPNKNNPKPASIIGQSMSANVIKSHSYTQT